MDTATAPTPSETVLPRPAEPLPTPALATATRKLADKLVDLFNMSDDAALAFAQATVDPSTTRRAAENPERLPVPGGIVLGVRTEVWAQFVMPDPRNPRIGPARRHPTSTLVGRDETARFRPIPDPETADASRPELVLQLQNQEHLAWAAKQARDYVIDQNDWRESIRHQGVMTEVWLTAMTFEHGDGTPSATVPVTAEGSSRVTGVHDILGVRSADVPYARDERKFRAHIRKLNDALGAVGGPDQLDPDTAIRLRCEKIPALLLVGFEPHGGITSDFVVAVKSLVALRHVDYPKPWGEATENEALGDAVVGELERRNLITPGKADWLIGSLTPEDAKAAGFSDDPAIRAATIARIFTDRDPDVHEAVRIAITTQSTRKRITAKLLLDVASSLILRSVPEEDARKRERMRRYLKEAYSVDLVREWNATFRDCDELAAAAMSEVEDGEPGPASRELAARSAYPLIVGGGLTGDRGTQHNDQPDRRKPGEVIERMRSIDHGIFQLRQAVIDFEAGTRIRAVDENGGVLVTVDGRDVPLRDVELRRIFAPAGQPAAVPAPETTAERLHNGLAELGTCIQAVADAVKKVEAIYGDDGTPAIDVMGADPSDCGAWKDILFGVLQKLPLWEQRHTVRNGIVEDEGDLEDDDLEDELEDDDLDDETKPEFEADYPQIDVDNFDGEEDHR
jgi:hypothetical protein